MTTQSIFWNLVEEGKVKVLKENICQDALADTPYISIQDFLDDAEEYGWVELA